MDLAAIPELIDKFIDDMDDSEIPIIDNAKKGVLL